MTSYSDLVYENAARRALRLDDAQLLREMRRANARWVLARTRNDDDAADRASDEKRAYQNERASR